MPKLTALTENTAPISTDLVYMVDDPAGSPLGQKVTIGNLLQGGGFGTWTPVIVGSTAAGTGTYTVQLGEYQKVGKLVFITCTIGWSAHTGTGNMTLSGLPVPSGTGVSHALSVYFNNITLAAVGNKVMALVNPSLSNVDLYEVGSGAVALLPIDAAGSFTLTGFYFID